jgi:hypothetical protein
MSKCGSSPYGPAARRPWQALCTPSLGPSHESLVLLKKFQIALRFRLLTSSECNKKDPRLAIHISHNLPSTRTKIVYRFLADTKFLRYCTGSLTSSTVPVHSCILTFPGCKSLRYSQLYCWMQEWLSQSYLRSVKSYTFRKTLFLNPLLLQYDKGYSIYCTK